MDIIYLMLWAVIQYSFILLLKLFQLQPLGEPPAGSSAPLTQPISVDYTETGIRSQDLCAGCAYYCWGVISFMSSHQSICVYINLYIYAYL